jgi:hypothetical protein
MKFIGAGSDVKLSVGRVAYYLQLCGFRTGFHSKNLINTSFSFSSFNENRDKTFTVLSKKNIEMTASVL